MDTRRKIVTDATSWRAPEGAIIVKGPFDPLLAQHAAQLERLRQGAPALIVCITDPQDPILPAQARAELVAALRCVDAVLLPNVACPPHATDLTRDHMAWRQAFLTRVAESAARAAQPTLTADQS